MEDKGMITFTHGDVEEISEGPYGYVILGLIYHWDDEVKCLRIQNAVFERPFDKIYEEDGKYFYDGLPIINYKMINIPEVLTGVVEEEDMFMGVRRRFYNQSGLLKYSVNPLCTGFGAEFYDTCRRDYKELYACVLSYDEKTMTGSGVGFDGLGKIKTYEHCKGDLEIFYKGLVNDANLRYYNPDEERYARGLEFGCLNLKCKTDAQGNKVYSYQSIWEE